MLKRFLEKAKNFAHHSRYLPATIATSFLLVPFETSQSLQQINNLTFPSHETLVKSFLQIFPIIGDSSLLLEKNTQISFVALGGPISTLNLISHGVHSIFKKSMYWMFKLKNPHIGIDSAIEILLQSFMWFPFADVTRCLYAQLNYKGPEPVFESDDNREVANYRFNQAFKLIVLSSIVFHAIAAKVPDLDLLPLLEKIPRISEFVSLPEILYLPPPVTATIAAYPFHTILKRLILIPLPNKPETGSEKPHDTDDLSNISAGNAITQIYSQRGIFGFFSGLGSRLMVNFVISPLISDYCVSVCNEAYAFFQ